MSYCPAQYPNIFFQFDFNSSFWRQSSTRSWPHFPFSLGLGVRRERQTYRQNWVSTLKSCANMVSSWTLSFQDSWEVLTGFQLFTVVTTLAPPSPNVEDSPSHTEPVWPSHVPFLGPSSVLLASGGHVLHRAGQRSSVSKEGKWYQCLPWCAFTPYLFHALKFAFKWFPVTFTSLMLTGWLLSFLCYSPTDGIFPKDKPDFIISFLFPQCGLQECHDLAFAHLSNIFSSTRPAWYLCSVLQLYVCFIVCLESIFPPPLPCTLSHRPAPPCPSKLNALISFC